MCGLGKLDFFHTHMKFVFWLYKKLLFPCNILCSTAVNCNYDSCLSTNWSLTST